MQSETPGSFGHSAIFRLVRRYPAGKKEGMEMTATGDALYLPVPSPFRLPLGEFRQPRRQLRDHRLTAQPRVYRIPRHDRQHMTYGAGGYATASSGIGKIIDIRV